MNDYVMMMERLIREATELHHQLDSLSEQARKEDVRIAYGEAAHTMYRAIAEMQDALSSIEDANTY